MDNDNAKGNDQKLPAEQQEQAAAAITSTNVLPEQLMQNMAQQLLAGSVPFPSVSPQAVMSPQSASGVNMQTANVIDPNVVIPGLNGVPSMPGAPQIPFAPNYPYDMNMLMYQMLQQGYNPGALLMNMNLAQPQQQQPPLQQPARGSSKRKASSGGAASKKAKRVVYTGNEPELNPPVQPEMPVWVVNKKFDHWPAWLVDINQFDQLKEYERRDAYSLVHFFGTNEYCYVPTECISPLLTLHPNWRERSKKSRAKIFMKAVQDVLGFIGESGQGNEVAPLEIQSQIPKTKIVPDGWGEGPDAGDIKVYNADGEMIHGEPFKPPAELYKIKSKSVSATNVSEVDDKDLGPQSMDIIIEHHNFKPLKKVANDGSVQSLKKREMKVKVLRQLGLIKLG
ncbi:hypothetical protein MP228_007374 [Amoeboaphelidium protococcarum]|nr:hypothetical protein MP228_007374 [Amoeboaphelidium protococcarum]